LTNNRGNSWIEFTNEVPGGLSSFNAPKNNIGFAAGSGGLILRYDNGVTNISQTNENIIADHFYLYQNFPNPFNPSTTISYSIPENGIVTLKVFDALGTEVRYLVDEAQEAGYHQVEFNAEGLSSGIYFYKLKVYPANGGAGEYNSTKKLVLLK